MPGTPLWLGGFAVVRSVSGGFLRCPLEPLVDGEEMTFLKTVLFVFIACILCLPVSSSMAQPVDDVLVELASLDPGTEATLGNEDMLYLLVKYESAIPLRFQMVAMLRGSAQEVGAIKNPAALHAQGSGEALVWVGYTNPTHIDSVRVTVMDEKWRELFQLSKDAEFTWTGAAATAPREPADWVSKLIKSERRKQDFVYDPSPQEYGTLYDVIFFLTLASVPAYILLQLHMLWRYKYRWRELAVIPLFPYVILLFYYFFGLNIETALQVKFLARYTPLAFLYLVALWLANKPPKA